MQDMNNDRKEKMLDDLLDGALAQYSNVEPRVGLENRIVARLAAQDDGSWIWNWKWAVVFAAACLLIVAVFVSRQAKAPQVVVKKSPEVKSVGKSPDGTTIAKAVVPDRDVHTKLSRQIKSAQPRATVPHDPPKQITVAVVKKETFPAAAPLSEQERLLLAYLRKTPREEIVKNSKPDEPRVEIEMNQVMPGMMRDTDRNTNLR